MNENSSSQGNPKDDIGVSKIPLPVLGELVPGGLQYGRFYLVEYEPQSLWYETSLTVTAHALRNGVKTEYHVLLHHPMEVREALKRLGVDVEKMEEQGMLRILDTYSVTTGLETPERLRSGPQPYQSRTLNVHDMGMDLEHQIKEGVPQEQKRWLHVDDATSVLCQYNEEKTVLEYKRTRWIPYARARDLTEVAALVTNTASSGFYTEFESFSDGIFDFRSREEGGKMAHYVRLRTLRGKACDTSWRRLRLTGNGEVELGRERDKLGELGIRGWIKGEK